jgi:hypothetical protein
VYPLKFIKTLSLKNFLLSIDQLKAFVCPLGRRPLFLGQWQRAPVHVAGIIRPPEIGQRIALKRNVLILRQGIRVLLGVDRFLPWKPGTVLACQRPLTRIRGRTIEAKDITSGIPQIETFLEIRNQTGFPLFLSYLYQCFLRKDFSNRVSSRKALHFCLRMLVDSVQRSYSINGVRLNEKHLELIVRPIAFVQVICDLSQTKAIVQGEDHPLDFIERFNWIRVLKNWRKADSSFKNEPRVFYKPLLMGLTKGALRNARFLSSSSFQETSRVLSRAALRGQIDYLLGLKENLILGIQLPIGTNARTLQSNILLSSEPITKLPRTIVINSINGRRKFISIKIIVSWRDVLYYLNRF